MHRSMTDEERESCIDLLCDLIEEIKDGKCTAFNYYLRRDVDTEVSNWETPQNQLAREISIELVLQPDSLDTQEV